jgi:hypothetical protein
VKEGPVWVVSVAPNGAGLSMGKTFVQWFLFTLLVGVFVAYVTSRTLPVGTDYLRVFQIAGVTAFAAYALGVWPMSIWMHRSWGQTLKETLDGFVFACLTGGTFGWLWPS